MVIELSLGGLLTLLGIPTAITSLGLWLLQRRITSDWRYGRQPAGVGESGCQCYAVSQRNRHYL